MQKSESIQLPAELMDELNQHLKKSSFKSVDDFIIYIIQSYLDQLVSDKAPKESTSDDEQVMKRLQDLGYM